MHCHLCTEAVGGTCRNCGRLYCVNHWGGSGDPLCQECHGIRRGIRAFAGSALLGLAVYLLFTHATLEYGLVPLLVGAGCLWLASWRFRSAREITEVAQGVLASTPDTTELEDLTSAESIVCLHCGQIVPSGTASCPSCGWSYLVENRRE